MPRTDKFTYEFEGITVSQGPYSFLEEILHEFDPDVVAIHAPTLSMARHISSRAPTVIWIHGSEALFSVFHNYYSPWELKEKAKGLVWDPLRLIAFGHFIRRSKPTAIVYVSNWMKRMAELYTLIRHPLSFVIPNPVDTDLFQPLKATEDACVPVHAQELKRASVPVPVRVHGLSVRSLGWKYGIDIAVKAYSRFRDTDLTILGTGPLRQYLSFLAAKYQSNVHFLHQSIEHDRMPRVYSRFGYFVAPSRTEAQGLAMCEAMACGLPIIAASTGGIPEFVKNGVNGLLVQPENPLQLRMAIERLISDDSLYDSLSENSARFAKENFSHERVYDREYGVFKLCAQSPRSWSSFSTITE